MRIKSLSDKIVLYFVIIGVTAIAIVSTYSFITSKNALLSRTFDQLTSVRVVKKNQIEQFFSDRLSEFKLLTNSTGIGGISLDSNNNNQYRTNSYLYRLFEYLSSGKYYTEIFIEIENGTIGFYNFNNSGAYNFNILKKGKDAILINLFNQRQDEDHFIIHDYIFDTIENKPRMFISGLLIDEDKSFKNKIAVEISLDAINAIMLEQNPNDGLGLSGESYIVGSDKLMRSNSRFKKNSIMQTIVSTNGVKDAFNDSTGTSVITDYRGIKVLSSYSKLNITGLDWAILAEIDYAEATKSIYFIRNNIMLLTIFVAVILFIISYIFSKRITLPLIKLTDATANIKSGNLEVSLSRTQHDEIGQLTNSFNSMAETLKEKDTELNNERNKRITAMIDGQELERQRLSRELHDGLGQSLIALKLKLESIHGKDVCAINKTIEEVKGSFDGTINEIRRISNDLMPAVLSEFGLVTTVKNICEDISENTNIDLQFSYTGKFNDLSSRKSIYLFRILQEALSNIVKHAEATKAEVKILRNSDRIIVSISDNGKGFENTKNLKNTGNGIPNMRERISLLNGTIEFLSKSEKGTQITIGIPLNISTNDKS